MMENVKDVQCYYKMYVEKVLAPTVLVADSALLSTGFPPIVNEI